MDCSASQILKVGSLEEDSMTLPSTKGRYMQHTAAVVRDELHASVMSVQSVMSLR